MNSVHFKYSFELNYLNVKNLDTNFWSCLQLISVVWNVRTFYYIPYWKLTNLVTFKYFMLSTHFIWLFCFLILKPFWIAIFSKCFIWVLHLPCSEVSVPKNPIWMNKIEWEQSCRQWESLVTILPMK